MKRIAILGAGGQARELAWLIRELNRIEAVYQFVGYIVGDIARLSDSDTTDRLLGDESWLQDHHHEIDCLAIGIGSPAVRCEVGARLAGRFPEVEWPSLAHPQSIIDRATCVIDRGVLLCAGAVCTTNITLGPFALVNFGCTIGHDARIGRGCVINPGANISGGVVLEDGVLIGTGAQILQYRRVGAGATVGAGSVVLHDVPPGLTVAGIPARPLHQQ